MIKIGIIGYGYWGPNLARCFSEADGSQVAAICDASPEARARAAKRYPGISIVSDPQEVMRDPTIDAVAIATPVRTHYGIALEALCSGKHVLVEKPMTETSDQSRRLIDEAAKRNLVLMVDHTFVYTPAVRKIRELVARGDLGDIYYYDSIRVNLGLFQRDVSVLWDLAVHDLSILEYVLGDQPVAVSANGACHFVGTQENTAYVTLFFGSGTIAHVNVNWLAPVKVRQTLIAGSRKMIIYDDLEPDEKVKVYDKGVTVANSTEQIYESLIGYRSGDMWAPQLATTEALRTEADHFIACVRDGETPITNGAAGLRVVSLLEGASLSMKHRGGPIDLDVMRRAS
ncbi:Gfo/Idh/MocA family protein [Azospirillum canadense]|uniref:Gfo/Idh/MocA family protein n=1 Tax=Azospirillum canadense TaxID=403962 RepID=UPI002225D418|nr:Gfo/Idh/MocA family oxidoreductase [Azospirillum canadense]MCW2238560.1 putative dehydrogenase [Azospirillum canadense]